MAHQRQEFISVLHKFFKYATENLKDILEINVRDLCAYLQKSIDKSCTDICCDVMLQEMKQYDQIITSPMGSDGSTLTISYLLPRDQVEGEYTPDYLDWLLGERFHKSMLYVYEEIYNTTGYKMSIFLKAVERNGGQKIAKKRLKPDSKTSGILQTLAQKNQIEISFEYLLLDKRYATLFTNSELLIARQRIYNALRVANKGVFTDLMSNTSVCDVGLTSYERDPAAHKICVAYYGPECCICRMNFQNLYGSVGRGFIQVHHIVSPNFITINYMIDPIQDLRPICPNCHVMLHKKEPPYSIEELLNWIDR